MDWSVLAVFIFVYAGMILGGIPGLALDRTGIALLGAIALLALGDVSTEAAWQAVDVSTIALLLGLMVVSAQFRLAGVYTRITSRLADANVSPPTLLGLLILVSGGLSAVLANDIVCLAMAPILIEGCAKRRLNPLPFLLALACASNVGSAATLIGNPQNMLIGQRMNLSFTAYLSDALVPATLGLLAVWAVLIVFYRSRWSWEGYVPHPTPPVFNRFQAAKGTLIVLAIMIAFLFTNWPREIIALAAAGIVLLNRRMASRDMLALVDWQLLVLFVGLFIVNHALSASGLLNDAVHALRSSGIDPAQPATLFLLTAALSNVVSNVPAVMLLLPIAQTPFDGAILALSSTLAGNLIIVGSIANIIVIDQAARMNIRISWWQHAKVGIPVTIITLSIAGVWLALR